MKTLMLVALVATFAAPAFAKNAKQASDTCTPAKCQKIQGANGWCPSERVAWCARRFAEGDLARACTGVPRNDGKPRC